MKLSILIAMVCVNAFAQQYEFKAILQPGMTIGNHTFTPDTRIDGIALSDSGEAAFLAHWTEIMFQETALFTSKRLVVSQGETLECSDIYLIQKDSIAINAHGQVAYKGWYNRCGSVNSLETFGIFIDKHLALTVELYSVLYDSFLLSDDGWLTRVPHQPGAPDPAPRLYAENAKGQILIAVNSEHGFFLLLGTPTTH